MMPSPECCILMRRIRCRVHRTCIGIAGKGGLSRNVPIVILRGRVWVIPSGFCCLPPMITGCSRSIITTTILFVHRGTAASQLAYRSKEGYGAAYSSAKGLLTGTQVFDLTDRSKYAITVYYYDEYGNPVQTRTRYVSGDYEMTYAQCDLSGNILESYTEHLDSRGVYRYRSP